MCCPSQNLSALRIIVFACLVLVFTGSTPAQTSAGTNTIIEIGDAGSGLLQAPDGNFYSYTVIGSQPTCPGSSSPECSDIYQITPGGIVTIFHAFQPVAGSVSPNADGYMPTALIVGTDGNFYGSTQYGGPGSLGVIFKITPGGVFTLLKSFGTNSTGLDSGNQPNGLIQGSDGNLYFTNSTGLYQLTLGGILTTIYTFPYDGTTGIAVQGTNATSLVQGSDGTFYITLHTTPGVPLGTTGSTVGGIVRITSTGTSIPVHSFALDSSEGVSTGGPLVEGSDGNFYGVNQVSSIASTPIPGAAFKVTPSGALTVLHSFPDIVSTRNNALFVGSDGNFYGATAVGGDTTSSFCAPTGCGTLYQLTSSELTTLHNFEGGLPTSTVPSENPLVDGFDPNTPLVQANDGLFYGTVVGGVFKFAPATPLPAPVQLTISPTTVLVNKPVTIAWKVLNAFSATAQNCGATVTGNPSSSGGGAWIGSQTGTLSGNVYSGSATITPTSGGLFTYALTCGGKESGFATLKVLAPLNVPAALPGGLVGSPYITPVDVFGGVPPYTTSVTAGALPPGMGVDPSTGVLTGNPQQFGTFTFGLQVVDSDSPQSKATGTTTLTVKRSLAIANGIVLKGTVGVKYSFTLLAIGGIKPYIWSLTAGTLPDGITLDPATGILSGTPTKQTTTPTPTITIQAMDSEGTPDKTTATLPFVILPPPPIASVEFTQAIQQYQTLSDLESSLAANGEPPVPIISSKPAVMRLYFTPVTDVTTVTVQVTGVTSESQTIDLQPDCSPTDQRAHKGGGCPSLDFYFTPPSGTWTADLNVSDATGNHLEEEILIVTSRDTAAVNLKSVTVCDLSIGKNCGDPSLLGSQISVSRKLMPTANVTVQASGETVADTLKSYTRITSWDIEVAAMADALYTAADVSADSAANQRTTYFGIYNSKFGILPPSTIPFHDTSGWAAVGPSHGAIGPDTQPVFGLDDAPAGVAHETGHTLTLRHTNLGPAVSDPASPGCIGKAPDPTTYWPFATNYVQSTAGPEYGFDVEALTLIDPTNTFDLMSYCSPQWISPINYKRMITTLGGGAVSSPSISLPTVHAEALTPGQPQASAQLRLTPTIVNGAYSQISGLIDPTAGVTFNPIFTQTMSGSPDAGSGTYSIQLRGAGGQTLYTRYFTPNEVIGDLSDGTGITSNPYFSEWVPVTAGTASFVVLDPSGNNIGTAAVTGTAPTVVITSPTAGFVGSTTVQPVSWTITDPDSTSFFSRVFYSTDGGTTWGQIGETTGTSDTEDFTSLPGSTNALIRVLVSDGVNTGSATSVPFTVSRKVPSSVVINTPANGAVRPAYAPAYLTGSAYDADDGFLTGSALQWSSSIQGALGTGSTLSIKLTPGTHTITLTAKDSDGNVITTTTTITIAGARPSLTLTTAINPSSCINATVSANPGVQGANLTLVQYSITGGATYIGIPTGSLPFTLTVPGSGSINLVARTYDASGQSAAQSTVVSIPTGCAQATKANPTITWATPASIAYGTQLSSTQLNASASVPGFFSYSPASGTVLSAGSQTLSSTFTPTDTITYAVVTSATILAVTPAQLTITPINATRAYGTANPAFTSGTTGFVNGDSATVVGGAPVLTTSATTTSSPGSYPISAAQGTLSAANYTFVFGTGTLAVIRALSTTVVTSSASPANVAASVTFTATVSPAVGSGAPTGTVTFNDGATTLGTGTLGGSGTASYTTAALAAGTHTVTAVYSGDGNYLGSTSSGFTQTVNAPGYSLSATPTTLTLTDGGSGQTTFTVTPVNGFKSQITFACSGLPAHATCTFSPTSLTPDGTNSAVTSTLTIATSVKTASALSPPSPGSHNDRHQDRLFALILFGLPGLMLARRRTAKHWGAGRLIIVCGFLLGLTTIALQGCGGTDTNTPRGTDTITVTASSGGTTQTASVTLTVQ